VRIAITGGTGFVGRHLARRLATDGHEVVLVARGVDRRDEAIRTHPRLRFIAAEVSDPGCLAVAFERCAAVAHCAGINRELGAQTYERVHVRGTDAVLDAARRAGVGKVVLLSFLRARPQCGSPYHESKWQAEERVRASGLDYTVVKAGIMYGRGDHLLDHLSHALHTVPVFVAVGWRERPIRPVAVEDAVEILAASLCRGRLSRQTVGLVGPETLALSDVVRRVAAVLDRRVLVLRAPVWAHVPLSVLFERTMRIPLVSRAQLRILAEGATDAVPAAAPLPSDLAPRRRFDDTQIRRGLPGPGPFGLADLRCWR
jgi:NADH dehydrogenase